MAKKSDEHVREICKKLEANDTKLKCVDIFDEEDVHGNISDEGYRAIAEAMKKNTTIEDIHIYSNSNRVFSVSAALSLAGAFLVHPKLNGLLFSYLKFAEFGPIALAMCQNKQLHGLKLDACSITSNLMESIQFLVKENALETLGIWGSHSEEGQLVDFAGTLANNKSLKRLRILNENIEEALLSPVVLEEIVQVLEVSANLQELHVQLHEAEYDSDSISRVAEAAKGHKSLQEFTLHNLSELNHNAIRAIGNMLKSAPALRELDLHNCNVGDEGTLLLSNSLESQNFQLKKLNLCHNEIGDDGASALAAALRANNTIEELCLWGNDIGDRGASVLAKLLSKSKSIVRLDVTNNNIGPEGATAMADALRTNKSLKALDLSLNPIEDEGAIHIANALAVNTTLESIDLGMFGTRGLNGFIASLPRMDALKSLELSGLSVDCLNSVNSDALLESIERNTTLEHFCFSGMYNAPYSIAIMKQVQRIMTLNRAGRRILGSPTDVPRSLWPRILAKSSDEPDIIYFFLHENPQLFMKQTTSILGKRKRDHSSCTIS